MNTEIEKQADDFFGTVHCKTAKISKSAQTACSTDVIAALYNELLMAVCNKFPGETRHQTALRYIREQENRPSKIAKSLYNDKVQLPPNRSAGL